MKKTISFILILIFVGCNNKTENNKNIIKATSEKTKHIDIQVNNQREDNIEEKSYKTVSFYNQNKRLRKKRIRACRKMKEKTVEIEKDCKNAKRSLQLSKRKNTNSFIDQKFL